MLFNLLLCIASLGAFFEKRQIRSHHRISVNDEEASIYILRTNQLVSATIKEISFSGVGLELSDYYPIDNNDNIALYVKNSYGEEYKFMATIKWHSCKDNRTFCGCEYKNHGKDFNRIVSFVYGDSQRWKDILDQKAQRVNTMKVMVSISFKGTIATYDCFKIVFHSMYAKSAKISRKIFAKDIIV